jgi:hypothetical protein
MVAGGTQDGAVIRVKEKIGIFESLAGCRKIDLAYLFLPLLDLLRILDLSDRVGLGSLLIVYETGRVHLRHAVHSVNVRLDKGAGI